MPMLPQVPFANPSKVYCPTRAEGHPVRDINGNIIAQCFIHNTAAKIAYLLNEDVRVNP